MSEQNIDGDYILKAYKDGEIPESFLVPFAIKVIAELGDPNIFNIFPEDLNSKIKHHVACAMDAGQWLTVSSAGIQDFFPYAETVNKLLNIHEGKDARS